MNRHSMPIYTIICMTFGLSACVTLDRAIIIEKNKPPIPESQKWAQEVSAGAYEVDDLNWVQALGGTPMMRLVEEALQVNSDVRVAYGSYRAAIAAVGVRRADRLPIVNGSLGFDRTEAGDSLINDNTRLNAQLSLSWELDVWGRIGDQIKSQKFEVSASQSDLAAIRLSIAGQVILVWVSLIEGQLLVDLSIDDVKTQARALRLTKRRFEAGLVGSSDVHLAASALANAQALQASRQQNFLIQARRLEILLRRYPKGELTAIPDLPDLPNLSGLQVPGRILQTRPDLRAAYARFEAAGLDVDVARKNLFPRISLSATGQASRGNFSDLFNADALLANFMAALSQPIFQSGRLKAAIKQQEGLWYARFEQFVGLVLNAFFEVENALSGDIYFGKQVEALTASVKESHAAEDRLEQRYREGLASILQLLDAQSRRISAEGQLISARASYLSNRVQLYLALGGGDLGTLSIQILQSLSYD